MPSTAVFDLDKTLTARGTWSRFVYTISRHRPSFWVKLPVALGFGVLHILNVIDRDGLKKRIIQLFLAGRTKAELMSRAEAFAESEVATGLRKTAREVVEAHKAKGDHVVIASAAVDLIADQMARKLGIDETLCTDLVWTEDDRLMGRLKGPSCYGDEKLRRMQARFGDRERTGAVTFYSDHFSDLDALLWADSGVAVNPSEKLRTAAEHHGLKIVDWDA